MATLSIGLPVYNGERFLAKTIESLRQQTFTDWEMIISDNCSTDKTEAIARHFASIDTRIHYHRHKRNYGAAQNFLYVLNKANTEFFMWASHDDIWLPNFIKSCQSLLKNHHEFGFVFTNIEIIDSYDRVIRKMPDFSKLTSNNHRISVLKHLLSPEVMGKANIIYSIYRLISCKNAMKLAIPIIYMPDNAISDNVLVLSVLSRQKLAIVPKILFQKREERKSDTIDKVQRVYIKNPTRYLILRGFAKYLINLTRVVQGTKFFWLPPLIMLFRMFQLIIQVPFFLKKLQELLSKHENRSLNSDKTYATYL